MIEWIKDNQGVVSVDTVFELSAQWPMRDRRAYLI